MPRTVVLAYSGGLDTSAIVPWLRERYDCEVIAFVGDVGQGDDELEDVEDKARSSGAVDCRVVNLQLQFAEEYVFPTLMSGAVYEGQYLLGTSMARPILAKAQVELAREVGADALAHGCTGKGNDQVRFESTFAALAPDLEVIAPWRIWTMRSREELLAYLRERNIPTTSSAEKIYSRDRNLWHVSHEGGGLEDPWQSPPEDVWMLTRSIADAPAEPRDVVLGFEGGRPRTLDGTAFAAHELVHELNRLAGENGVGRIDVVENRLVGMKSRGCYETPAGTVLMAALRGLEELVLDRATLRFRESLAHRFADVVYDGRWFTAERRAILAAVESIAERLCGEVRVRMYRGTVAVQGRRSEHSLYAEKFATFGEDEVYDQKDAAGFIRLFSLPARIEAMKNAEQGRPA